MHSHTSEWKEKTNRCEKWEKPEYSQNDANGMSGVTQCDVIQRKVYKAWNFIRNFARYKVICRKEKAFDLLKFIA